MDKTVLERSEVTVDKQMQKELNHLSVKCNYFDQGCAWTGLAIELPDHLEECQCRLVACIYDCGVEFEVSRAIVDADIGICLTADELLL